MSEMRIPGTGSAMGGPMHPLRDVCSAGDDPANTIRRLGEEARAILRLRESGDVATAAAFAATLLRNLAQEW